MVKDYEIFRTKLETAITTSGQDIGAIYFIMKDVLNVVQNTYYQQVQNDLRGDFSSTMQSEAQKEEDVAQQSE